MKTLIEKLANGNVEYISPVAQISVDKVELNIVEGDKTTFDFYVDSINDRDIKGVVYSTDARVEVLDGQFFGKHNPVKIFISASHLKPGTHMECRLVVTSNAGEMSVPCTVDITKRELNTGVGDVTSEEDFVNLLSYDYEEALKLFVSKAFKPNVLENDLAKCTLYDVLMKNTNKEIAMEEFLVTEGLKEPVKLTIANNHREYRDINEAFGDVLTISRNTSGYVDIDVEIEGDILHNSKLKITNDDFVGNTYEYQYLINNYKLHKGENRSKIILKTSTQNLEYEIVVINTPDDNNEYIDYKKKIFNMMNSYIDFRCGKISGKKWMADMLLLSDSMLLKNPEDMTAILLKTQVSILSGDEEKAINMLSVLSQMVNSIDPDKVDYYCYYLYLKTIHKKNASFTDDIKREIKSYFENGYDRWVLLWMIFYLDERYTQNPSLKYTLIKEQFNKGCHSPVMYYEALAVLNTEPALLRIINPFEIQVLNFGAKRGAINDKLARQVMLLLEKDNNCSLAMLKIIMKIYENNPSREVLEGICRMLINADKKTKDYFKWFERGVDADIRLAELMESYVYSISNQGYVIFKPSVYMYFGYSTESLGDYQAYFFADVIKNKGSIPDVYDKFKNEMVRYATKQLAVGRINEDLAILYEEVINEYFSIPDEADESLPALVNSYELKVDNNNVSEVIIYHKETCLVEKKSVSGKKAIVEIYTKNPGIAFVDDKGRYLTGLKYKISPLINIACLEDYVAVLDNIYVDINKVNACMKNPEGHKGQAEILMKLWKNADISNIYKKQLSSFIVDYCQKNYDAGEMTDFLLEIDTDSLDFNERIALMEILIRRGYFKQVTGYITKYGFMDIGLDELLDYATEEIKGTENEKDEKLLAISRYLFMWDKYDAITLGYLQKYFDGPTAELYSIWKTCKELGTCEISFEEKMLAQMIFEGRKDRRLFETFDSYYQRDTGRNLKKAFYTYVSYYNFVEKSHPTKKIFDCVEKDIEAGMKVSEICKMEYLSYIADRGKPTAKQLEICHNLIHELADLSIVFEYYKVFNKWFKLPYNIFDKTIIDYRTNPKNKVYIMYKIYDEEGNMTKSATEEMSTAFPGIFIKQLTMFYGEKLTYNIVEKNMDEVKNSEEKMILLNETDIYNDENKFGQINSMLISAKIGREDALEMLMKNYEFNRRASEELFKLS